MTVQISDSFLLKGQEYALVGLKGGELFNSEMLGLHPIRTTSACWNGYVCQYSLNDDNHLILERLQISLGYYVNPNETAMMSPKIYIEGPIINGLKPFKANTKWSDQVTRNMMTGGILDQDYELFNNAYKGLGLSLLFNGAILLGDGYLHELHQRSSGFRSFWKHKTVLELQFEGGHLVERRDVSDKAGRIRKKELERRENIHNLLRLQKSSRPPIYSDDEAALKEKTMAGKRALRSYLESAFSLNYDLDGDKPDEKPGDGEDLPV